MTDGCVVCLGCHCAHRLVVDLRGRLSQATQLKSTFKAAANVKSEVEGVGGDLLADLSRAPELIITLRGHYVSGRHGTSTRLLFLFSAQLKRKAIGS